MFIYLVNTGLNLIQGLKNLFLLVMHLIKKDKSVLIQKQGKLLFQWMLLFWKDNPSFKKKLSSRGEHRRRRKFLGCYFESPT